MTRKEGRKKKSAIVTLQRAHKENVTLRALGTDTAVKPAEFLWLGGEKVVERVKYVDVWYDNK